MASIMNRDNKCMQEDCNELATTLVQETDYDPDPQSLCEVHGMERFKYLQKTNKAEFEEQLAYLKDKYDRDIQSLKKKYGK